MKKSPLSTVNLFFILIGSVGILTACCDSSNENSDYNLDSEKMENVLFHDSRLSKLADSLNVDEEEISDSLRASENVDLDTFFLKDKSLLY